ncbi:MAG: AlwI family type II restriction endonuclease, partial [Oscillospiraceae bacterium]|nr:AlwI family type II restriction endonuclease [Oscillospiraceae bacterium]
MSKKEYKPLLFTTTIRNPQRFKAFIDVLLQFDGKLLTNALIDEIIFELVARKLYTPLYATRTAHLKEKLIYDDVRFSDKDTAEIIANSPQDHKEAGFDKGWASRFDTFYKFAMELGFVFYEMNKPIEVSETGVKLAKSIDPAFANLEQQVFLNAFVKYQRDNPFRRIQHDNKPLVLLLQVIDKLRGIYGEKSAGISR